MNVKNTISNTFNVGNLNIRKPINLNIGYSVDLKKIFLLIFDKYF